MFKLSGIYLTSHGDLIQAQYKRCYRKLSKVGTRLRWLRIFSRVLIFGIVLVGIGALVSSAAVFQYGRTDHAEEADTIIILGSGTRADGRVSPAYARRIRHAMTLFKRGLAPTLLCTGGYANRWRTKSEALACKEYLLELGVPEAAILIEEVSRSTEENAIEAKKVMDANGLSSAIIVTDNFHILRSEIYFRAQGIIVYSSAAQLTQGELRLSTGLSSSLREIAALGWYMVKSAVDLPFTETPF
jgi:uncharacterized SAM-binding protein YcdF (DUF218 family)